MRGIRTITIDLDDTLWPIRPVIERADQIHDLSFLRRTVLGRLASLLDTTGR